MGTCHMSQLLEPIQPALRSSTFPNSWRLYLFEFHILRGDVTAYWMDNSAYLPYIRKTPQTLPSHMSYAARTAHSQNWRQTDHVFKPQPATAFSAISIFIKIPSQGRTMKFMYLVQSLVCIPFFHASLVFTVPLNSPTQPALIQFNSSTHGALALG